MKFKCELPVVTYDLITVEFCVDESLLTPHQLHLLQLLGNKNHKMSDFELAYVRDLFVNVSDFFETIDDKIVDCCPNAELSDISSDYERTVESFEVIE